MPNIINTSGELIRFESKKLSRSLLKVGSNPSYRSLQEQIEITGLYPITCLTHFTKVELFKFVSHNIVLRKSIDENPVVLNSINISSLTKETILNQCKILRHVFNQKQDMDQ